MFEVSCPTANALGEFVEADAFAGIGLFQALEAAAGAAEIVIANANAIRKYPKPNEIGSVAGFEKLAFDGVNFEAEGCQVCFDGDASIG